MSAMQLFGDKGYNSTSVADIRQHAGVNSGSLYHFFPTKQDLLVAVLETYRDTIEEMLLQPAWVGIDDPIERVFALLSAYRGFLDATECTYGCPIGSLALELHEPDPPVRALMAANFAGWTRHVAACFEQAGDRLPASVDRNKLAMTVLAIMEGGVMQARTFRTLETFDASIATLRDYIDRLQADVH